jgi:hypothetical protein
MILGRKDARWKGKMLGRWREGRRGMDMFDWLIGWRWGGGAELKLLFLSAFVSFRCLFLASLDLFSFIYCSFASIFFFNRFERGKLKLDSPLWDSTLPRLCEISIAEAGSWVQTAPSVRVWLPTSIFIALIAGHRLLIFYVYTFELCHLRILISRYSLSCLDPLKWSWILTTSLVARNDPACRGWLSPSSEGPGRGAAFPRANGNKCLFLSVSREPLHARRNVIRKMRHEVLLILSKFWFFIAPVSADSTWKASETRARHINRHWSFAPAVLSFFKRKSQSFFLSIDYCSHPDTNLAPIAILICTNHSFLLCRAF